MSQALRSEQLDLRGLGAAGAELAGSVPLTAMPRLVESLLSDAGAIEFELRFGLDEARRPTVTGHAGGAVELCCQRCLSGYVENLSAEIRLVLVQTEAESEYLPPDVEPLLDSGGPIRVAELIEDELILALPIIPMHRAEDCCAGQASGRGESPAPVRRERENPFAVLAQLKLK